MATFVAIREIESFHSTGLQICRTNEVYEFYKQGKKKVIQLMNPSASTGTRKEYARLKTDAAGVEWLYRMWLVGSSDTEEELQRKIDNGKLRSPSISNRSQSLPVKEKAADYFRAEGVREARGKSKEVTERVKKGKRATEASLKQAILENKEPRKPEPSSTSATAASKSNQAVAKDSEQHLGQQDDSDQDTDGVKLTIDEEAKSESGSSPSEDASQVNVGGCNPDENEVVQPDLTISLASYSSSKNVTTQSLIPSGIGRQSESEGNCNKRKSKFSVDVDIASSSQFKKSRWDPHDWDVKSLKSTLNQTTTASTMPTFFEPSGEPESSNQKLLPDPTALFGNDCGSNKGNLVLNPLNVDVGLKGPSPTPTENSRETSPMSLSSEKTPSKPCAKEDSRAPGVSELHRTDTDYMFDGGCVCNCSTNFGQLDAKLDLILAELKELRIVKEEPKCTRMFLSNEEDNVPKEHVDLGSGIFMKESRLEKIIASPEQLQSKLLAIFDFMESKMPTLFKNCYVKITADVKEKHKDGDYQVFSSTSTTKIIAAIDWANRQVAFNSALKSKSKAFKNLTSPAEIDELMKVCEQMAHSSTISLDEKEFKPILRRCLYKKRSDYDNAVAAAAAKAAEAAAGGKVPDSDSASGNQ